MPEEANAATREPRLQELLRELPRQLRSEPRVKKLLVRVIVLAFLLPLHGKPLNSRPGMGLTYQKLFGQSLATIASMVRTYRADVLSETRKLLRVGPEKYVTSTLRELEELFKE